MQRPELGPRCGATLCDFCLRSKKPIVLHHSPMNFTTEVSIRAREIQGSGGSLEVLNPLGVFLRTCPPHSVYGVFGVLSYLLERPD